jgi:hypothetical protein
MLIQPVIADTGSLARSTYISFYTIDTKSIYVKAAIGALSPYIFNLRLHAPHPAGKSA